MILAVTLNPVLDTTFFIEEFREAYRTDALQLTRSAGGKGNNVARALTILGEPVRALVPLGGPNGKQVAALLAQDGIEATIAWISDETRLQVTVVNRRWEQRAYFAPSPTYTPADAEAVRRSFEQALQGADAVCLCGSSPGPGADALLPEFIRRARERGLPTLLDSSGRGLRSGIKAGPMILKCNQAEAAMLLGRVIYDHEEQRSALRDLLKTGAAWAVLTLGHQGALFAAQDRRWFARPPQVDPVNVIGCGDVFTAGLMAGLVRGESPESCLRLGMAGAVANTLTWEPGRFDPADVERLAPHVQIEEI